MESPNFPFLEYLKKPVSPRKALIILGVTVLVAGSLTSLALLSKPKKPAKPAVTPPLLSQPLILSLESPVNDSVVDGDQVVVKGKTLPNTAVVFYTDNDQNSVESDTNGQFEGTIALSSGINSLIVTAYAENGEEKSTTLDLVYDDQVKGTKTAADHPPGQAKKEEEAGQKATIGNVEQVTTNAVILEEKKLKKKTEVVVDKNTKVVGQEKKTLKLHSIKPKDLVAIISTESATATGGGLLKKAIKIFVRQQTATPSAQLKRHAVYGVITNINNNQITLAHPVHRERIYNLLISAQTVIKIKGITTATLADLQIGQRIAAVGDLNENGVLVAKRIHVIPGKATGLFEKYPLATPSATITPTSTPSATPTLIATPSPTSSPTP